MRQLETEENGILQALSKIDRLVCVRERSVHEIKKRLKKEGFQNEAIEEAVMKALACGLLNDARYADNYIRSKIRAGKGSAGILHKLSMQEIDVDSLEGWPYDYDIDEESEIMRAVEQLQVKPVRAKNAWDAAYRRLLQCGYPISVAHTATRLWHEQKGSSQ